MNLFEYKSYSKYLNDKLSTPPFNTHGSQSRLAKAAQCQPIVISRILAGKIQLTLEQAHRINQYFRHSQAESRFFILLVQYARAASKDLRLFCETEINEVIEKELALKNRFAAGSGTHELPPEQQATYYSSWLYSAIHIALTIPSLRTVSTLSETLNIDPRKIEKALSFLVSSGMAVSSDGKKFQPGKTRIHLPHDSDLVGFHHSNLRLKAIESLTQPHRGKRLTEDLHYSSIVSLSFEDTLKVKIALTKAIEGIKKTVRISSEETLYGFNLDFFQIGTSSE